MVGCLAGFIDYTESPRMLCRCFVGLGMLVHVPRSLNGKSNQAEHVNVGGDGCGMCCGILCGSSVEPRDDRVSISRRQVGVRDKV